MQILTAALRDLGALRRLERACFQADAWSFFDLCAVLTWPNVVRLKAVRKGEMVGFIAAERPDAQGWAWIATIGVDPRYQRAGIGRALLRACQDSLGLPRLRLTVRMSNESAIALYRSEGYQTADIWKSYYSDGEDGLLMEKDATLPEPVSASD